MRSEQNTRTLSELERAVMQAVWDRGEAAADDVRSALPRDLKDSTVRTVLRRLEQKGFVRHRVEGRTYLYRATGAPHEVAARAVRQIVERFCGGSVEQLLVGMVDHEVLGARELRRLAEKIAARKETGK